MLYGVKGQVKFQVAPIELKLGESNAGHRASSAVHMVCTNSDPSDYLTPQIST